MAARKLVICENVLFKFVNLAVSTSQIIEVAYPIQGFPNKSATLVVRVHDGHWTNSGQQIEVLVRSAWPFDKSSTEFLQSVAAAQSAGLYVNLNTSALLTAGLVTLAPLSSTGALGEMLQVTVTGTQSGSGGALDGTLSMELLLYDV